MKQYPSTSLAQKVRHRWRGAVQKLQNADSEAVIRWPPKPEPTGPGRKSVRNK